jgi:DNA-directed RNA polymerase subunit F
MTQFFSNKGKTYSLADIQSISTVSISKNSAFFTIELANDESLEIFYSNQNNYQLTNRFSENPVEKVTKIREKLFKIWGEFKSSIPNIG